MTDAQTIAENYIAFWNTAEPAQRRDLFDKGWRADAVYADPMMRASGAEEIGALVARRAAALPGLRLPPRRRGRRARRVRALPLVARARRG